MRVFKLFTVGAAALAGGLLLAACGGSSGGSDDSGTVSFSVTDAPVDDVANVWVTFAQIDIKPSEGDPVTLELDEPRQIDLLTLQGSNAAPLIEGVEIEPGEYEWVRLFINGGCASSADCVDGADSTDSFVVQDGGGEVELFIPGQQPPSQNPNPRFLHLASPFIVPAGGNADFTIDVELRKALTDPVGQDHYLLRPALRLVNNVEVGTITGTVADSLANPGDESCENDLSADTGNAVYLYAGSDAAPGDVFVDVDGNEETRTDGNDHPVTVADVKQNSDTGEFEYTIGFVEAGDYTVAFTCDALLDDPQTEDSADMIFDPQEDVTVQAGQESEVDFTAAP